jgi:hypothetical protein
VPSLIVSGEKLSDGAPGIHNCVLVCTMICVGTTAKLHSVTSSEALVGLNRSYGLVLKALSKE